MRKGITLPREREKERETSDVHCPGIYNVMKRHGTYFHLNPFSNKVRLFVN